MRNFSIVFLGLLVVTSFAGAREVRTDPSIEVTAGAIEQEGMLGTSGGAVFLEFSNGVRFLNAEDRTLFSGEILPPAVIPLPAASPRTRMNELATFELVADTGTEVLFADEFDTLHPRNQLREQYKNPDLRRDGWVQLLMPIEEELVQVPKLWEFLGEEEGWARRGGTIEPTAYDDVRIFSAKISRTGVYGIFDENPLPSTFATDWEVLTEPEEMRNPAGADFEPEVVIPPFISDDPTQGVDGEFILDVESPEFLEKNERQVQAIVPQGNQKISPMSPNYGDPAFVPETAPVVTLIDPALSGGGVEMDSQPATTGKKIPQDSPTADKSEITPPPGTMLPSTGVTDGNSERASGWMIVMLGSVMFLLGASVLLAFKKPVQRG